jgi:proteasome lid subunit RPN8/RPN11
MSETNFGVWNVAESPIAIEYSLEALEQIRLAVQEGFQRLSRGGIEAGGVLYGTREGRTVKILAQRPIPCEHTRGPAFLLSDQDKAGLTSLLDRNEAALRDMVVVGWYVSHTKSEICLNDSDLEIYDGYFAAPWQVTLVLRPGRYGGTRAGFFVRETDGSVKAQRSYLDFNVPDRTPNSLERVPGERPPARPGPMDRTPQSRTQLLRASRQVDPVRETPPVYREEPPAPRIADARLDPPRFQVPRAADPPMFKVEPKRKLTWLWLLLWVVSLAVTGFGVRYFLDRTGAVEPLGLAVTERDGQLQIEWNKAAKPIRAAIRGVLSVSDGPDSKEVPLNPEELAKGTMAYMRHGAEVQIKLSVFTPDGKPSQESTRFLGREISPKESEDLVAMRRQRDQLAAEVQRLEAARESQLERIQQLERTIRLLETRLNIRGDKQ